MFSITIFSYTCELQVVVAGTRLLLLLFVVWLLAYSCDKVSEQYLSHQCTCKYLFDEAWYGLLILKYVVCLKNNFHTYISAVYQNKLQEKGIDLLNI